MSAARPEQSESTVFRLETDDAGIATLTFDSPGEKVNTFGTQAMREFDAHLAELEALAAAGTVKGVVFASAKDGNFIAGADIRLIADLASEERAREAASFGQRMFERIQDLPVPTLAAINGSCMGGGTELALACTYRIAADHPKTRIGLPETQLGVLPGWGGTFRLPRTVGWVLATKMILTGQALEPMRALKAGLVDAVYPPAFFDEWTAALFARLAAKGSDSSVERARAKAAKRRKWFLEKTGLGRRLVFRSAAKDLQKKTGGNYPAQTEALRVLKQTSRGGRSSRKARDRAARIESAAFGRLAVSEVSGNLIRIYFGQEALKRQDAVKHAHTDFAVRRAAVLGAGVMGGRIAWLFSSRDIPVVMKDIAWDAVHKGYQSAKDVYDQLVAKRKLDAREVNLRLNHIHGAVDYASIGRPDVVVEAVVERMEVKKAVLAELEGRISPDAIIATNTSALSVDEMAAVLQRPQRFAGMHFFNPVNRMPLVEVVRGSKSDPAVVGDLVNLSLRLGKSPVVVTDSPGFLVNRLLLPYLNEAAQMLSEGVDYLQADRLFTSFGMPMGPYTLLDEVGIDVGFHVAETLHQAFGERMATAPILDQVKAQPEFFGKKTGAGFYRYSRGKQTGVNPAMQDLVRKHAAKHGSARRPDSRDIFDRAMLNMVNEAAYALEAGIVGSAQELDMAMILGTGFPPFRGGLLRWADAEGTKKIADRLSALAEQYGSRFKPAPLLVQLAGSGARFHG